MPDKIYFKFLLSCLLVFSILTVSLPVAGFAQTLAPQTAVSNDLAARLKTIEEKTEARRKELGIPGVALAIVKDGKVVFAKGFGWKNFEKQIAVTPDTQFAIGSASKAFTALSVLMAQDEGKLSVADSPKKYLPYFRINDAETDKNIEIRDLLSHSSGLNRTDLAWASGKLNREEIIKVAGEAKPVAKLREKFLYQNVMFVAAGEIASKVQNLPFENLIETRIFKPLEMTNSNLSVKQMQRAKDFSYGYEYNSDTKETKRVPFRDLTEIAPAGAINSSANDMAKWVKFVLNKGKTGGKRLISERGFDQWTSPQMKIGGGIDYGFGWFLQTWQNLKVVQHGGNIDGFNSMVAIIPEKNIGFVLLTNVSNSSLGGEMMQIVWENLLNNPNAASSSQTASADASRELGKYRFEAAGTDIKVVMKDGKLIAIVPGQPNYVLQNVGGRKYKLTNAPDGFFITFKDAEAFLEQPQGSYILPKVKADSTIETKSFPSGAGAKELVGGYTADKNPARRVEINEKDGKVSLLVEGQEPYELREKSKDVFALSPLPDDYSLKARRDANGKLIGITLAQPEGEFVFTRLENSVSAASANAPKMSVDELMSKVTGALGGEANWRKLNSSVAKFDVDFVNQGVKGYGMQYQKASNKSATETIITALGKQIGTAFEYFDGAAGGEYTSFEPGEQYSGKQLEDERIGADFYGLLDWKKNYRKSELRGTTKVGGEDAYVVVFEPEKGNKDTIYFSAKTFLPLKLESVSSSATENISLPFSETYGDYRVVDGVMIPYKTTNSNSSEGDVVTTIKEIKYNVAVDDKIFRVREKTKE